MTSAARGRVKGQPIRFINGHQNRGRVRQALAERFWSKVDQRDPDECWEWTAGRTAAGYGYLATTRAAGPIYAHRWSYEQHIGTIPEGRYVCHRCDNPPCVNPAHLFVGTHADNMADMKAKGRVRKPRA
jgi:hypothetical protein